MTLWPEAADYLLGQSGPSLAALYWFFLVFEVPRYVILFALFALMPRRRAPTRPAAPWTPTRSHSRRGTPAPSEHPAPAAAPEALGAGRP